MPLKNDESYLNNRGVVFSDRRGYAKMLLGNDCDFDSFTSHVSAYKGSRSKLDVSEFVYTYYGFVESTKPGIERTRKLSVFDMKMENSSIVDVKFTNLPTHEFVVLPYVKDFHLLKNVNAVENQHFPGCIVPGNPRSESSYGVGRCRVALGQVRQKLIKRVRKASRKTHILKHASGVPLKGLRSDLTRDQISDLIKEVHSHSFVAFSNPISALERVTKRKLEDVSIANVDWRQNPERILDRLTNPKSKMQTRFQAVLVAETTAFSESLREKLLSGLSAFINENRWTRDDKTITVVGSAVRKYAMNMPESSFESYSEWFLPKGTQRLHHEVELELVKVACWRLQYLPVRGVSNFPMLHSRLVELATAYLHPRWIPEKNFAAIALSAVIAVVILDGIAGQDDSANELLVRVMLLQRQWFFEMVVDQIADAVNSIELHDAELAKRIALNSAKLSNLNSQSS